MKHTLALTVSALALGGMILGGSSTAEAHWSGRGGGGWGPAIADGVLGGLAAGALASPVLQAPTYYYAPPAYYPPPVTSRTAAIVYMIEQFLEHDPQN